MSDKHRISEYIDNLSFKKSLCVGIHPDEVYEAICNLTSMYNDVLAEAYDEMDRLKSEVEVMKRNAQLLGNASVEADKSKNINVPLFDYEKTEAQTEKKGSEAVSRPEMNDRDIRRLRRSELLEILIESSKENEKLRAQINGLNAEIEELNGKLSDRTIKIEKAGTLAEAALLLNGVFDSAQAAAQQYLDNLQSLYEREEENCIRKEAQVRAIAQRLLDETNKKCKEMTKEAEEKAAAMNSLAYERCKETENATAIKCKELENEASLRYDALTAKAQDDVVI